MDNNAVSLDTVLINVESNAGKAAGNIGQLATHLNTLRNSVKGGFNNINKLAEALNKLTPALEKLNAASSNLKAISNITNELSQLKDVKTPAGLKNAIDSLTKLPDVMNKMDVKTFENLKRVSNELAVALTPLAEKMRQIAEGYSAFSKIQNTFGKSASTAVKYFKQQKSILSSITPLLKKIGSGFINISKGVTSAFGKGAYSHLKKFHSKAKQIFLSLLGTRTLFTMIRKAASEYQAFDEELQKFSQNVWRAFGAQLAPVLYYVMDLFKQFVRVIYSVVLALTGIDLIAKANARAMAAWSKSSKDTLGSLQKFDDLNVVEFDKDKGEEFSPIQMDKIDLSPIQKVIDWVRKLKKEIIEAWNSGEWYGVGKVLAEGINMGVQSVLNNINTIRDKFFEIGRDFGDFLNGIIENTKWEDVGKFVTEALKLIPDFITEMLSTINWDELGKGINNFFKGFDAIEIINSIGRAIVTGLTGLGEILAQQDWGAFGKTLGDTIKTVFNGVAGFLDTIPWKTVGEKVRDAILNIDWKGVWDSIVNLATEAFEGLEAFIAGLFDLDSGELVAIKTALVGIGTALITYKIAEGFTALAVGLKKLGDAKKGLETIPSVLEEISKPLTGPKENPLLNGAILDMKGANDLVKYQGLFGKLKGSIMDLGDAFTLLGKNTLTVNSISGITGVSSGLLKVLTPLTGMFTKLTALFGGSTFAGAAATVGIVIAAVVVAVMALVEAFKELWSESESFRNTVKELGSLIADTFLGIINTLWTAIQQGIETLKSFYEKAIKPVFDLLVDIAKPILEALIGVFNILWKNVIKPFVGFLSESFLMTWDLILIAVEALGLVLQPVISILEWLWKKILSPIVDFLVDVFLAAFNKVTSKFKNFAETVKNVFGSIRSFLDEMLEAMRGGWKSFANFLIEKLEWLINKFISGINWLIKQVNKVSFNVPDWVPGIGGQKWGFNIKQVSEVSLPRLETGTNEIPYEGVYHLHPGEAVVPKKYNPALGNGGSDEMVDRMDTLIELMNNMNFTNNVYIGNKKIYEGQQSYNKMQQNKYGTINLY